MATQLQRVQTAFVSISLAALLAACSGTGPGTPGAPASTGSAASPGAPSSPASSAAAASVSNGGTGSAGDACTIITADEVSKAVGFAATPVGSTSTCYFQNADSSKYLAVSIFASQADMALMLQIEPGSRHVDGLGDDAFWAPSGGILFVRKGDRGFELLDPDLIPGALDAPIPAGLISLARSALANL